MADSPFKGLLYSPEVLGGIGLLTAGLSGQNPGVALPQLMQGMKTASMFKAMEEEEEKRKFIKEFGSSIPEEDQAFFKAYPKVYLQNKYKKKGTPNVKEIYKDGDSKTFDISKDSQLKEFLNLTNNQGWTTIAPKDKGTNYVNFKDQNSNDVRVFDLNNPNDLQSLKTFQNEPNRNVIRVPSMDKSSDLSQKSKGKLEGDLLNAYEARDLLENIDVLFEPEFVTYIGKGKAFITTQAQKLGFETSDDLNKFLSKQSEWKADVLKYTNKYRKHITGVAAGEKEIKLLASSIANPDDAPSVFKAKIKAQRLQNEMLIRRNEAFLAEGIGGITRDADGKPTGKYKEYLEKNPIQITKEMAVEFVSSLANDDYSNEAIALKVKQVFGKDNYDKVIELLK